MRNVGCPDRLPDSPNNPASQHEYLRQLDSVFCSACGSGRDLFNGRRRRLVISETRPPLVLSATSLSHQQEEVTAKLRSLIFDIYDRHNYDHPVFSSPQLASTIQMMRSELNSRTVRQHAVRVQEKRNAATSTQTETLPLCSSPLIVSDVSSRYTWKCDCGRSFHITSNKTIQKHRAMCGT